MLNYDTVKENITYGITKRINFWWKSYYF
jgi:hypothetical protein